MTPITGGCLCGALRYEASALRFTGEAVTHTLTQGGGRKSERNFCPHCGGLVYGGVRGETDQHTIYAGSLDDPTSFKPTIPIFNSQRPAWVPLPPGVIVFERMPG